MSTYLKRIVSLCLILAMFAGFVPGIQQNTAVALSEDSSILMIAAGEEHTLALLDDGSVWAWGHNQYGQIGDKTTNTRQMPVNVIKPDEYGSPVASIAAGANHSLAVLQDGRLLAWGCNKNGQLGDSTTANRNQPKFVVMTDGSNFHVDPWTDGEEPNVSAGFAHTMAINSDDSMLYGWGLNDYGQLGVGDNKNRINPTLVEFLYEPVPDTANAYGVSKYEAEYYYGADLVAAGYAFTLAVLDGVLYSFGNNTAGQLGQGDLVNRNRPIRVLESPDGELRPTSIRCGAAHALVLVGQTLYGWGSNNFGQLQLGVSVAQKFTEPIYIRDTVYDVQAGYYHTVVLQSGDEAVYIQGYNSRGQLGNGFAEMTKSSNKVDIPDPDYVFDFNFDPEEDYLIDEEDFFPEVPDVEFTASSIVSGYYFVAALDNFGDLWLWGDNGYGQLGDGTFMRRTTPFKLPKRAFYNLDERKQIDSIKLDKTAASVGLGYKYGQKITVSIDPITALYTNIDWKIANTDVLSMIPLGPGEFDEVNGVLTNSVWVFGNMRAGSTTITGTAYNGKSVTCNVTVRANPEDVEVLAKPNKLVARGSSFQLRAEVRPINAYDKTIIWSLHDWYDEDEEEPEFDDEGYTDNGIAEIDELTGKLTAKDIGKFYVRAQSRQNPKKYKMIPVNCGVFATKTEVYSEAYVANTFQTALRSITLYVDYDADTNPLLPTNIFDRRKVYGVNHPFDVAGYDIIWKSSSSVCDVIVDETCDEGEAIIVANKVGTTTVTATAADKSGATTKITVNVVPLGGVAELIKPALIPTDEYASYTSYVSVKEGSRVSFKGKVYPTKASQKLKWTMGSYSSLDGSSAPVGNIGMLNGMFNAVNEGTCEVIGTTYDRPEEYSDESPLDPNRAIQFVTLVKVIRPVQKLVILGEKKKTVTMGFEPDNLRFDVGILPQSATCKAEDLAWSSSNVNVATVDDDGDITLVGPGSVKITATATDGTGKKVSGTLKVMSAPQYIVVTPLTIENPPLAAGKSKILKAKVYPLSASQEVTWEMDVTEGANVATLDTAKGRVKGLGEGIVTIRAVSKVDENVTSDDSIQGSSGDCVITCVVKVKSFKVTPANMTVISGSTIHLKVKIDPIEATLKGITMQADSKEIEAEMDGDFLEVDDDGFITLNIGADVRGIYTVRFYCDGKTSAVKLNILDPPDDIEILNDFDAIDNTIWKGKTIALRHRVLPLSTDQTVVWYSSNESVAKIDAKGNLKAVGPGEVEIYCVTKLLDDDGAPYAESEHIELVCEVPVTSVKFVPSKAITLIEGGEAYELGVSILPLGAFNAEEWEYSAQEKYISIVQNEESLTITPEEAGTETITVTHLLSGKKATITITVKGNPDEIVINRGVVRSTPLKKGTALKLTAQVFPSSSNQKVYWESEDTTIAKVSSSGSVTVTGRGEAKIWAWTYNADGEVIESDMYEFDTLIPATGIKVIGGKTVKITDSSDKASRTCETSPTIDADRGANSTWAVTSSNTAVADANVNDNGDGTITLDITDGGSNGTCNITVRVAGKSAIIKVTVNRLSYKN